MITINNKKNVEKPTSSVTNLNCGTNAIILFMEFSVIFGYLFDICWKF